jgi:pimeloyl-ACP methyl ester carboxylesterase
MPASRFADSATDLFIGAESSARPSLFAALGELRAPLEGSLFWLSALTHRFPKARPDARRIVMLIPGFMAGDATLAPMSAFVQWLGHRTFYSGISSNSDCPRDTVARLGRRLVNTHERFGEQIVIIGQSLGGVYARQLAREYPQMVERAITLGSPIRSPRDSANVAVQAVARTVALVRGKTDGCLSENCRCGMMLSDEAPNGVAVTAVYSRTDGIVHWDSCVDRSGAPEIENIEVMGSHCGMGVNPDVCRIVADRLALPSPERGSVAARTGSHPIADAPPAVGSHQGRSIPLN